MSHIYILMIWTVVGAVDVKGGPFKTYHDWRPLGEFHAVGESAFERKSALEMCEEAAQQLGIDSKRYRCVRSK